MKTPAQSKPVRVLLVTDDFFVRDSLLKCFAENPEFTLAAWCRTSADAEAHIKNTTIAVVDLDQDASILAFVQSSPQIRALGVMRHPLYRTMRDALSAGIQGLLTHEEEPSKHLLRALLCMRDGGCYFSPNSRQTIVNELPDAGPACAKCLSVLTPRVRQAVLLLRDGLQRDKIAEKMSISSRTVDIHFHSAIEVLELHGMAELRVFAANLPK